MSTHKCAQCVDKYRAIYLKRHLVVRCFLHIDSHDRQPQLVKKDKETKPNVALMAVVFVFITGKFGMHLFV